MSDLLAGYVAPVSVMQRFISECCELADGSMSSVTEVRQAYYAWSVQAGGQMVPPVKFFTELLGLYGVSPSRAGIGGKQVRVYSGIRLVRTEVPLTGIRRRRKVGK